MTAPAAPATPCLQARPGFIAVMMGLAALVCLGFAGHIGGRIIDLHRDGVQAAGVVVAIDVGRRGLQTAIVSYQLPGGRAVRGRDLHRTQFVSPNQVGQQVALRYKPEAPEEILVLRGATVWLTPGLFLLGVLICGAASVAFWRQRPPHPDS